MKNPFFLSDSNQQLYLDHVYIEYDGPVFFLCIDNYGARYIGAASIETSSFSSWILTKVSNERLRRIQENEVTLYNVFKESETGFILRIKSFHNKEYDIFEDVSILQIEDDYLPAKNVYLDLSSEELFNFAPTPQQSESELLDNARTSLTPLCDLEIIFPANKEQHFVRAHTAGTILNIFDSLRLTLQKNNGQHVKRNSERRIFSEGLDLYGIEAASLVFKLRAPKGRLVKNQIDESLLSLIELLQFEDKTSSFELFINDHSKRTIGLYKKLASLLLSNRFEICIRVAIPELPSIKEIFLNEQDLLKRKAFLDGIDDEEKEILVIHGKLSGLEPMKKAVFSFLPDEEDEYITGKIEPIYCDELRQGALDYGIPATGTIGLIKITKYSATSESDKIEYIMSSFITDND